MRKIKLDHVRVTNGRNVWHVTGTVRTGGVDVTERHGDVNDEAGLREAVEALVKSSPRYTRIVYQ